MLWHDLGTHSCVTDNHRVTFWRDQISGRWSEAFSQRDEELFFFSARVVMDRVEGFCHMHKDVHESRV